MSQDFSLGAGGSARLTGVRYRVILVATLMSVLLYLDRFCLAFARPYVRDDLGLAPSDEWLYLNGFFLAYALAQVPSGWLGDRFGPRLMLAFYILLWSACTAVMGLAAGIGLLLAMRLGVGVGQAGAYPTSAIIVRHWIPFAQRGAASGVIAFGGRIGLFIAPVLTAYLIVAFVPANGPSELTKEDIPNFPRLCYHMLYEPGSKARPAENRGGRPRQVPAGGPNAEEAGQQPTVRQIQRGGAPPDAGRIVDLAQADRNPALANERPSHAIRLGRRIQQALPPRLQPELENYAREYALFLETGHREKVEFVIPFHYRDRLLEHFNQLIGDRNFARPEDFAGLKSCEREALDLMKRPRGELTSFEVQRLNRLLLEAAYPDDIRKIYIAGWRPVLLVYGLIGIAVAAWFWLVVRDWPDQHPRCSLAEQELIRHGAPQPALLKAAGDGAPPDEALRDAGPGDTAPRDAPQRAAAASVVPGMAASASLAASRRAGSLPVSRLMRSGSLWLMSVTEFFTNVGWIFLALWLPDYLYYKQIPIVERGWLAAIPPAIGWLGMLGGGPLTDRLTKRLGLRWGRALPVALSRFLAAGAYLTCLLDPSPWAATAAFAVVAFGTDLGAPAVWAFKQDIGGRYVGSVLGWGNMWGNLGAAFSFILDWFRASYDYQAVFLACAAAFVISGLAALGVNAAVPIMPEEGEK